MDAVPHATGLISIIAVGLVFALIGGMAAHRLKLPPLVGYLVAGIAIGPFTPGFVGDAELAGQLAEIGVILLMFGVGLHFSINDLMAVRRIALPGALVQIAVATALGCGLALLWGWGLGAGLVFGLALSVASTVVLLRALEENGLLDSDKGRIAVGWLIVEDLAMVLALVLLPALTPSLGGKGGVSGDLWVTLGLTLAKVGLFLTVMLVGGRRLVPWLLARVARTGSRELFTLAVLALALGIAFGSAELFGVSFALGAFFAGMVLAESDLSHQAAADSLPLQDAFAVLFFVSVGMLFDPGILVREPLSVLVVLGVILVGKSVAAVAIVLVFGHSLSTALTVAASLAQIGEFSFILVGLGIALDLLPEQGRDLVLGGALLSITLNPLFFALVARVNRFLEQRPHLARRVERRAAAALPTRTHGGRQGHAILVGHGRVGSAIAEALRAWELPFVVVDRDRRRVEDLRATGVPAVFGDAAAPGILQAADVTEARLLIVASPETHQARRIVAMARDANPEVDTLVRTHSDVERRALEEEGVGLVLLAERELALGMMRYALRSMGLREGDARLFVDTSRSEGTDAALSGIEPSAPELRPHRGEAAE